MMLHVSITVYFVINALFAGYIYCDSGKFNAWAVLWLLFGCPLLAAGLLVMALKPLWKWANGKLEIKFWFKFYLSKEWDKIEIEKLETINKYAEKRASHSVPDRIFRKAIQLINKRNNYQPQTTNDQPPV